MVVFLIRKVMFKLCVMFHVIGLQCHAHGLYSLKKYRNLKTTCDFSRSGKSMESNVSAVFQITYKGRGSIRNFEGSIDVDLFKSSQVDHLFCRVMLPALSGF